MSDSCSLHPENDTSGVNLKRLIDDECQQFRTSAYAIVADNVSQIKVTLYINIQLSCSLLDGVYICKQNKDKLVEWCDQRRLSVILTTGGSGFAPTDLTPEVLLQAAYLFALLNVQNCSLLLLTKGD